LTELDALLKAVAAGPWRSLLRSAWLRFGVGVRLAELVERNHSKPGCVERSLRATLDPQLAQDAAYVGLDRLLGYPQFPRDLLIRQPARQQPQYVDLAV
jgi:hypothetical protein